MTTQRRETPEAVAELLANQLEIQGYHALPCGTCGRTSLVGVHQLHDALRALAAAASASVIAEMPLVAAFRQFVARERGLRDQQTSGGQHVGYGPSISPSVLKKLEEIAALPSGASVIAEMEQLEYVMRRDADDLECMSDVENHNAQEAAKHLKQFAERLSGLLSRLQGATR